MNTKLLLIALLAIVACTAKEQDIFSEGTMTLYGSEANCKTGGTPITAKHSKMGECADMGVLGYELTCLRSTNYCIDQSNFTKDATCNFNNTGTGNSSVLTLPVVCGQCYKDGAAYSIVENCQGPHPVRKSGCDQKCENCAHTTSFTRNECLPDAHSNNTIYFGDAYPCGEIVKIDGFKSHTCAPSEEEEKNPNTVFFPANTCVGAGTMYVSYTCKKTAAAASTPVTPWMKLDTVHTFNLSMPAAMEAVAKISPEDSNMNDALDNLEAFAAHFNFAEINTADRKKEFGRTCDVTAAFVLPNGTLLTPLKSNGSLVDDLFPVSKKTATVKAFLEAANGFINVTTIDADASVYRNQWSFAIVCANFPASRTTAADFLPAVELQPWIEERLVVPFAAEFANGNASPMQLKAAGFFVDSLGTSIFYPANVTAEKKHKGSDDDGLSSGAIAAIVIGVLAGVAIILFIGSRCLKTSGTGQKEELNEASKLV